MKTARDRNPRESANLFSKLTFFYTNALFQKGFTKGLQEFDIYEVLNTQKAQKLGDELESEWKNEVNNHEELHILRTLWKIFGKEYIMYSALTLIVKSTIMIAKPLALGKLISHFDKRETSLSNAYCFAIILIACSLVNTFYIYTYILCMGDMAVRVRAACCSLIYRKTLGTGDTSQLEALSGRVLSLVTKDVYSFDSIIGFTNEIGIGSIQIIIMACVLYYHIGFSALLGIAFLLLLISCQGLTAKIASNIRLKSAKKTDQRIRLMQEVFSSIKSIKMFTWEEHFTNMLSALRKKEMKYVKLVLFAKSVILNLGIVSNKLSFYICLTVYVYFGHRITAENIFVVLFCYEILYSVLVFSLGIGTSQIVEASASLKRINEYLTSNAQEPKITVDTNEGIIKPPSVTIINGGTTADNIKSTLRNINLELKAGLNILTGPVGSGKTSTLKLILREFPVSEGSLNMSGSVSYASQEPWLFPGTIKQNILLGKHFDDKRYTRVIEVCALKQDLNEFPKGDDTILIDWGQNLSLGQKARINLARAVYKDADIYLLDDALAALDVLVAQYVFDECIKGFLKGKVCVFVTHHTKFLEEADKIVVLQNGTIAAEGTFKELETDRIFSSTLDRSLSKAFKRSECDNSVYINNDAESIKEAEESNELTKLLSVTTNGLCSAKIYHETKKEGKVNFGTYRKYFQFGGITMFILYVTALLGAQIIERSSEYFLSRWVDLQRNISQYKLENETDSTYYETMVSSNKHMVRKYSIFITLSTAANLLRALALLVMCCNASVNLYKDALSKTMKAVISFFDKNLLGNILNRFSKDLGVIDEFLPFIIADCFRITSIFLGALLLVIFANPLMLVPSCVFLIVLFYTRYYLIETSRSIKRLECATRSPVVGHLNASLRGITTIKVHGVQSILQKEFDEYLDVSSSAFYMYWTVTCAFGFCLDILSALYLTGVILIFLIFETDMKSGKIGLILTQTLLLMEIVNRVIGRWTDCENLMTSVERIAEYTGANLEKTVGENPGKWPKSGKIEFRCVNLFYPPEHKYILKGINFIVHPKQKVGVVGRTGAGKTSLVSALFRLYEIQGSIYVDDVNIKDIQLQYLRSKMSIIPQDPLLITGTVRNNLDPRNEYPDSELWLALGKVQLKSFFVKSCGLDSKISDGGRNFSQGERQLICLARALIRKNKILVLDEATANVDPRTDMLIQSAIKEHFAGCTIIAIAHRLSTVLDYDKVIVLENGVLLEFDDPRVLIQNKDNKFYKMVQNSGIV